jgi:hypothetical protein
MKFKLTKASDWNYESEVEINTLEELVNFTKENGNRVVLDTDDSEITIYDNYLE